MRGYRFLALTVLLVWAIVAAPVQAITFGTRDTALRYPYVGALVAEFEPGQKDVLCTGTLIAASVFLTAGHCTDFLTSIGIAPHDVWVTFDLAFSSSSTFRRGTYHTHSDYGYSGQGGFSDPHDLAVVVLDSPATGITPARLPTRNVLNTLNLRTQRFTAVGYGTVREIKQTGPHALFWDPVRRYAGQGFLALRPRWLSLSMNPSTGSGGTCYGDSGGPHFLGDTNRIVSITVTGDAQCRATDVTYRLDTDSARAFLAQWVSVP